MPHALLNTLLLEEYCNIFLGKTAFAFKKGHLIQKPWGLILFSHPFHNPAILTHPSRPDQGQDWTCHHTRTRGGRTSLSHSCPWWIKKKKNPLSAFQWSHRDCRQVGSQQPGSTGVISCKKLGALHQEGGTGSPPSPQGPRGAASGKRTWHRFLQRETLPLPTV